MSLSLCTLLGDVMRRRPIAEMDLTTSFAGFLWQEPSDWAHFALNAALSTAVTAVVTYTLKQSIREERPDGTDVHSFPSGHSSIAFAGAHVLFKEFHQKQPWLCVAGYAVASYTAVDRVCRNRHRWGDVAAGAAIGILSTELSYWLGSKILKNTDDHVQVAWSPVGVQVKLSLP